MSDSLLGDFSASSERCVVSSASAGGTKFSTSLSAMVLQIGVKWLPYPRDIVMKPLWLIGVCLFSGIAMAESPAEQSQTKAIEIPLDQIWAAHSGRRNSIWHDHAPKTRDIAELERENFRLTHKALWDPIIDALRKASPHGLREGQKALPGFAVIGSDREALRGAYEVLVEEKQARETFTPDDEITLVFFSHASSGRFVQLEQVERTDSVVSIEYRLVPFTELNLSLAFALTPMSKLPEGTYRVEMVQLPMEKKFVDYGFRPARADFVEATICQPFEFRVMRRFVR